MDAFSTADKCSDLRLSGDPGGVIDFHDVSLSLIPEVASVLMLGEGTRPLGNGLLKFATTDGEREAR